MEEGYWDWIGDLTSVFFAWLHFFMYVAIVQRLCYDPKDNNNSNNNNNNDNNNNNNILNFNDKN